MCPNWGDWIAFSKINLWFFPRGIANDLVIVIMPPWGVTHGNPFSHWLSLCSLTLCQKRLDCVFFSLSLRSGTV